ncbi:hypothetical protein GF389_03390 [Candidatus Dojkabacteria bacterium]|nr:hypothetical protein [Candidatus Dojkabacteria bacterium]
MSQENPIKIYEDVPYGDSRPDTYTSPLDRKLAMDHLDPDTKRMVTQRHPFVWGMDYYSASLDGNGTHSVTVTNNLGFNRNLVSIEGLEGPNPDNPNVYYSWQSGLTRVLDYYFHTPEGGLNSILGTVRAITNKEVELYYYDPSKAQDESAKVAKLKRNNGQEYYAVFIHNPKTLGDIVAMVHELGHIVAGETQRDNYTQMYQDLQEDPDWISAVETFNNTVEAWGDEKPTAEQRSALYRTFYGSVGFRKKQDIEMIIEVDAWSAAIELIHQLGITHAVDPSSDDFTNYMWWAIKTRIPDLSEPDEQD